MWERFIMVGIKYQTFASLKSNHSFFFPAFLALAQRAFANADSLALAAALIVNFLAVLTTEAGLTATAGLALAALIFAHLAFCAATIRALPAALIVLFFLGAAVGLAADLPALNFDQRSF
jgi:hypothetical protein